MENLEKCTFSKLLNNARIKLQILNTNPTSTGRIWDETGSYTIRQVLEQKIRYLERMFACLEEGSSEESVTSTSLDMIYLSPLESFDEYDFNFARYLRYCSEDRALTRQSQTKKRLLDLAEHSFMEEFVFEVAKNKFVEKWESARQESQTQESSNRCEYLQKDTIAKEVQVKTARQAGVLIEEHYNYQVEKTSDTIDEWMQRFEREMDDLEARFQRARAKKNHWNDMIALVEQRKDEIHQLEQRENAHLERIRLRELYRESAVKIQAWWRGVIVRRGIVLGRRRRKKKKKKGKGGKKSKKNKK